MLPRRALALTLSLVFAAPALAQPGRGGARPPSKEAREEAAARFEEAETHYKLQEYDAALEKYRESYRLSQAPELLFNIGQCYRKLGKNEEALTSYRAFLRDQPDSPRRPDVERLIGELELLVARAKTVAEAKPTDTLEKTPPADGGPADRAEPAAGAPEGANPPAGDPAADAAEVAPPGPTDADRPGARPGRIFLLAGAAGGALSLIAGGVGLADALGARALQEAGDLDGSRARLDRAHALGTAATILAAAAGAAGLTALVVKPRGQKVEAALSVTPRGAALSIRY